MDKMSVDKLDVIRSEMTSAVFAVLVKHAGGSFDVMKDKPEYIALFNYACSGIDSGYKEVYLQCQN